MILFLIGMLEMVIITTWTKVVTKTQVLATGLVTLINIFIWYYVLETIVDDISNWHLIISYAIGCSVGAMASMLYFRYREQREDNLDAEMSLNAKNN